MANKNITRLVKSEQGGPHFETIDDTGDVIKLAARAGELDLVEEFGYPADREAALDIVTQLAIGAGLDALRDAGIPLVRRYKTTTKGTQLPASWGLPEELRDDTGVIFACAFPGVDFFASEARKHYQDQARRRLLDELTHLRDSIDAGGNGKVPLQLQERIEALLAELEANPYTFERRFLFKLLSMGHSQFAELIGARGPEYPDQRRLRERHTGHQLGRGLDTQWAVPAGGRDLGGQRHQRRGARVDRCGFLASGAAATDEKVEDAAIPFDRRRHGMIIGMGAASLVVESLDAVEERGLEPICQVLSTITANSAFHGTRLDVEHISQVMETLIQQAESKWGLDRHDLAAETVFFSHETYTPARGGSAQAEIFALRRVFGAAADRSSSPTPRATQVIPWPWPWKRYLAVKSLETGLVPPVANIKEIDPELGDLHLSRGGEYPVRYALRLGAGFGSQISMSLLQLHPSHRGSSTRIGRAGVCVSDHRRGEWQSWLNRASGYPAAQVEVERRTLRVRDEGPPALAAVALATPSPRAESRVEPPAPEQVRATTSRRVRLRRRPPEILWPCAFSRWWRR